MEHVPEPLMGRAEWLAMLGLTVVSILIFALAASLQPEPREPRNIRLLRECIEAGGPEYVCDFLTRDAKELYDK